MAYYSSLSLFVHITREQHSYFLYTVDYKTSCANIQAIGSPFGIFHKTPIVRIQTVNIFTIE